MLYKRLISAPSQSFLLLGARGTGKSTWLRQCFGESRWVDLLDERRYQELLVDPGAFAEELVTLPRGSWVVVDEVQRMPNLLNEVHRLIERHGLRFALCGSSARKLRRAGVNLLAGRALPRRLHPFVAEELGTDFSLDDALRYGTLPIVHQSPDRDETLAAYVTLYLREEIQAEAAVRNLPGFARFLRVAALFHGQTLNVSSLARDSGVARTTINGYLDILEDTLVAFRLPAFEGKLRVREHRHPKLFFIDAGIARALAGSRGEVGPGARGALLEGLIAEQLRVYIDHRALGDELLYWSPAGARQSEVDFLVRRGDEWLAVEVKTSARIAPSHLRGLRAVSELRGLRRRVLVFLGARPRRTEDGIDVLDYATFAEQLADGTLWEDRG